MEARRAELERKRQKLEQLRMERLKKKEEKEKKDSRLNDVDDGSKSRSDHAIDPDELLSSLGITLTRDLSVSSVSTPPTGSPNASSTASSLDHQSLPTQQEPQQQPAPTKAQKKPKLSICTVHQTNIPPRENVTYNKQTQTAPSGERDASEPAGKSAHPLDYYVIHWDEDDGHFVFPTAIEWDDEFQVLAFGDVLAEEDGSSLGAVVEGALPLHEPHQHKVTGLPHIEPVRPAQTPAEGAADGHRPAVEQDKPKVPRELSEEERQQILLSDDFRSFLARSSRVIERALCENVDICIDYSGTTEEQDSDDKSGIKLSLNRVFADDRWSKNRIVTSFDWSSQFPELLVASYGNNYDSPNDPDGVCLVWNMKFKKTTPEYIFHCQSAVVSACFAKFHPNLIIGGTYSGQIALWDNRNNRRTPVQRSPLSAAAHTHPVYCVQVVGTQNAHNLVSVSTDGKFCTWSLDMLSAPQDVLDLTQQKQSRAIAVTSLSFPIGDCNNFIVGSEEGAVYTACRHGTKAGILEAFEGHQGPVTAVHSHGCQSQVDLSHLFLTSSFDWTVKLWSLKESKPIYSFEDNGDYVYDVRWSPVHPALFACVDGTGRLDLWNLNNDTELPTVSEVVDGSPALNRVIWTPSGHQVAVGDDAGKVWVYDVGEQLAVPKSDEWSRFVQSLQELKNNQADQELDSFNLAPTTVTLSSSAPLSSYA
ncbi:cytoplasmic dynein 1 intermediate chain 2-like isoform X7 [Dermacentor albipictus]|uniref:cytoplasmic dynein 1 intermediate chain 2-like isoform X7 n=1 Tax=Dermacentor albipictus TaxID=60249 RepID=UPI0031FCDFCE